MKKFFIFDDNLNLKQVNKENFVKKNKKSVNLPLANYLNIGYYLVIPLIGGSIFGLIIKKPILGIFLGTILTFYNLIRLIKTNARN